ncbi:MAG: DNA polymerase III subunit beta [Lachnospiraceae bacterium]|nr:DNA polymerase III subunit beta [Candidatus Minthocola equi]
MKLSFNKNDLIEATSIAMRAVSTKTTMPILSCILIEAKGDSIKISGNDMELAIETKVKGKVIEEGEVALDAKLFSEIIRKLPEGEVLFLEKDLKISIDCGNAHFSIPGKNAEEFVKIPEVETKEYICVSEFTLKEVIRQTIFSIAQNDNNKTMTGELFEIKDNNLKVVSLDGHRISIRNIKLRDNYAERSVIVPGKSLNEISRIIPGDAEKDVYIFFTDNYIVFEFGTTVVLSRLIDGQYFKVDKMISSDYETKLTLSRKDLLDTIDRSMLLVRETDKKPIVFNINDEGLEASLTSVIGTMRETVEGKKEGQNLLIGFNPRFLSEALRAIDEDEVSLYMTNPKTPCFIRDAENNYIYLILPINFISN